MENRLLRYFITIAEQENISRAAEVLSISQPALSRQLSEFEEYLGVKLFERGNRKLTLTDKGVLLYERAKEIIDLTDKTEREIKESNEIINGKIVIGSGVTLSTKILSKMVKNFIKEYPLVTFELITGTSTQIKEKMDKGLIDIGLFIKPVLWNDYEIILLNSEDRFGILMRKDAKWAKNEYITPQDLKEMTLSIPKTTDSSFYMKVFNKNHEKLNVIGTHDMINNATVFVEDGIYQALTLEQSADEFNRGNLCFIPIKPEIKTTSSIAWKKDYKFSPTIQKFIDYIKNELKV